MVGDARTFYDMRPEAGQQHGVPAGQDTKREGDRTAAAEQKACRRSDP